MQAFRRFYVVAAAIAVAAAAAYVLLPHGELLRDLAAIPLVASLLAVLFQLFRDETAHQRTQMLQDYQNRFALAASSHMANVAFDRHVQFCEEYVAEVQQTLQTLFRNGATEELFRHTTKLSETQAKFVVWLTPQIEADLELFEFALRKLGATAGLLKSGATLEDRQQRISDLYRTLADVMGHKFFPNGWEGQSLNEEIAVAKVIQRLRGILGTEELTTMRTILTTHAAKLGATDG
jgi:hypothetical protein